MAPAFASLNINLVDDIFSANLNNVVISNNDGKTES